MSVHGFLDRFGHSIPFEREDPWKEVPLSDRKVLADLLFQRAKKLIFTEEKQAIRLFEVCKTVDPESPEAAFRQSLFLFDHALHVSGDRYLSLALDYVEKAIASDDSFFDAWYLSGDIFVHLGLFHKDAHYFSQAQERYEKAQTLFRGKTSFLKKLLWDWGLCWYFLGKHSGEAVDIKKAIEKFRQAENLHLTDASFYRDVGNAWAEMGILIKNSLLLEKATDYYQKAVRLHPQYFEGWLSLAHTFQYLYRQSKEEKYLTRAHSSYVRASDLKGDHLDLWLNWGNLFLTSGRIKEDIKHLRMSTVKFSRALEIHPDHPDVMSRWGEALIILGNCSGDLAPLKQAEKKILAASEILPRSPDIRYRYGFCLYALGQYFSDRDYYVRAIENFEKALTLDGDHFFALNGMGLALYALGDRDGNEKMLRDADAYFRSASEIEKDHPELWNNWGMTGMRLAEISELREDLEDAVQKFERALACYPSGNPSVQLLYNYGCALDFLGGFTDDPEHFEKSIRVLRTVLKTDPNYVPVHYNLALVYTHLAEISSEVDHYVKAIEEFRHAVEHDPEDEVIWNAWGMTFMHLAQLIREPMKQDFYEKLMAESEMKLRQAVSLGNPEAFYNLCCYHSLAGNFPEAMHYLHLAERKGALPGAEQLMYDDRIESLRHFPEFRDFLETHVCNEDNDEYRL